MRIVGLKEFMTLESIMYCEYNDDFEEKNFCIKWQNCGSSEHNDWVKSYIQPMEIECQESYYDDGVPRLELAEKDSTINIPMDFMGTMREAMYYSDDDPIKFAVYEKEDIKNLINVLEKLVEETE